MSKSAPPGPDSSPAPPEEVFRAVADFTYDWESWIDASGQLVWVNPAVERITGYGVAECFRMGDYPLPLVHPEDRAAVADILRAAAEGGSGNDFEFRVVTKTGETRWLAVSWQGLQQGDGVPLGFRTSVRDIHERKLAERRLQEAMRWAEQSAAARQEFLATMSHELRTPLQCVVGYAQLLCEELTSARHRHFAETIVAEGEAMLRIVGSVLDFSSLQAVESLLEERDFDLIGLVEACVRAARPLADRKGLSLTTKIDETGVPRRVRADDLRLRQVLMNLLGNALKFTEQGHVEVALHAERPAGARSRRTPKPGEVCRVTLTVSDTGPGMSDAIVARLFTPFFRGDPAIARRHGGTGLGLATARRLCELMGGTIRVESAPGEGSRFFVELPLTAASPRRARRKEDATSVPGDPLRAPLRAGSAEAPHAEPTFAERYPLGVLVVDDSPAVLELTTEFLRLLGYEPTTARGGREAVNLAAERAFDLILMDLHMPDLDGMTAARLIRAQQAPKGRRPVIVALTANPFARAQALSNDGGMDGFLTKPLVFADLKEILARVASRETLPLSQASERSPRPEAPSSSRPLATPLDETVLADLRETLGSDGRPLLERLGRRVIEDGRTLVMDLESAAAAGDRGALRQLAHRLKGNALLVGATEVAQACQRLESLGDDGSFAEPSRRVVRAQEALVHTLEALLRPTSA